MRWKTKTLAAVTALSVTLIASGGNASGATDLKFSHPLRVKDSGACQWLDAQISDLLQRWDITGGAIAIIKDSGPCCYRSYGYATLETHEAVTDSRTLFRIASVSKPITAAAALSLVQQGKLHLDDKVFDIVRLKPPTQPPADPRIKDITIRDLLNMTAGWDKERSGDPILQPYIQRAARGTKTQAPADFDTTINYVLRKQLDFAPGSRFAYSNFAYGLLGKVIEAASGQSYETFVRDSLPDHVELLPGRTRFEDRLKDEATYYAPLERKRKSFVSPSTGRVAAPYARAYLESDLPIIGWLATAPDLARLFAAQFAKGGVFATALEAGLFDCPDVSTWRDKHKYFAMGWEVVSSGKSPTVFYKDGTLPGTRAFAEHTTDGITWVALFNTRPPQKKHDEFAEQLKKIMSDVTKRFPEPL